MNNQNILKLVLLLGGLALPLGLIATVTNPGQTTTGQQSPSQAPDLDKTITSTDFTLLDEELPIVVPISEDGKGQATITIINNGDATISNWSSAVTLHDDSGRAWPASEVKVAISPDEQVAGHTPRVFQVDFNLTTPLPKFERKDYYAFQNLSGRFFFKAGNTNKSRALQLIPAESSPQAAWLIWGGLGIALILGIISIYFLWERLSEQIEFPEWTTSSLMTNITLIGTLLTTTSQAMGAVTQPHYLQKAEYTTLSILFGALVLIAPLIYNSIRSVQKPAADDQTTPKYEGYVWVFIGASIFTLWGAFGQYALVYYFFSEFAKAHLISYSGSLVFHLGIILAGLLLCVYAVRTIRLSADEPEAPPRPKPEADAGEPETTSEPELVPVPAIEAPLRSGRKEVKRRWPLL